MMNVRRFYEADLIPRNPGDSWACESPVLELADSCNAETILRVEVSDVSVSPI
jgi:hypothetical protein